MELAKAIARTWAEIDEDALRSNLCLAKGECRAGVEIIAVLKGNAYGMGIPRTAQTLREAGITRFAVACASEAMQLLDAVPGAWVLVLGEVGEAWLRELLASDVRLTCWSPSGAQAISRAATISKTTAHVHFKLDTGLFRLGFLNKEAACQIAEAARMPGIDPEGLFSHLSLRDRAQDAASRAQFMDVLVALENMGISFAMPHLLDSIGMVRYPDWQMRAVRVGAFLFGNAPNGYDRPERLRSVLALKTRIVRIADAPAGAFVGYDDQHPLARGTRVATLCAGYSDGYPRALSGKGEALIRGMRARVLGLVCMDQMMVDVTEIPDACVGDEATLLGDGIPIREYAAWGNLNRNEALSIIGRRVPRVYLRNGAAVHVASEL